MAILNRNTCRKSSCPCQQPATVMPPEPPRSPSHRSRSEHDVTQKEDERDEHETQLRWKTDKSQQTVEPTGSDTTSAQNDLQMTVLCRASEASSKVVQGAVTSHPNRPEYDRLQSDQRDGDSGKNVKNQEQQTESGVDGESSESCVIQDQLPHSLSSHRTQLRQPSEELVEGAFVLVRRKKLLNLRSAAKAKKQTHVSDLVTQCPDLSVVQLEPVAVDGRMYNRWARLPREVDPECEEPASSRRPMTLRSLQYSGSLKAASLIPTIVRNNPELADAGSGCCLNFKAGVAPIPSTCLTGNAVSLADPKQRQEVTSSRPGTREDAGSFALSARVAEYLPFLTNERQHGSARKRISLVSPSENTGPPLAGETCPRRLGSSGVRLALQERQHNVQCLPMNTAALLFSKEVDMRSQRYSYINRRAYPVRVPKITSEEPPEPDNDHKQPELKRVQFVDLAEVKKVLLQERDGSQKRARRDLDSAAMVTRNAVSARSFRSARVSPGGGFTRVRKSAQGRLSLETFMPVGLPIGPSSAK